MKPISNIRRSFTVLTIAALALVSCGKAPRKAAQADQSGQAGPAGQTGPLKAAIADGLNLRFVSAGEDPEYPGADQTRSEAKSGNEAITSSGEIEFKGMIQLPSKDGRAVYLVWDEATSGTKITHAFFENESRDALNERRGGSAQLNARYDEHGHRWFIPLREIVGNDDQEIDPANLYLITLDLILNGQDRQRIKIKFRVNPPLPQIRPRSLAIEAPHPDPSVFVHQGLSSSGWVLAREEYENPSRRPVRVYLSPLQAQLAFRMQSRFYELSLIPDGFQARRQETDQYSGYDTRLILQARVASQDSVQLKNWTSVPLPPKSKVVVEWVAHVDPLQKRCSPLPEFPARASFVEGGVSHAQLKQWQAARLEGTWGRSFRVGDPNDSQEKGPSLLFGGEDKSYFQHSSGAWFDGQVTANCSGIYW